MAGSDSQGQTGESLPTPCPHGGACGQRLDTWGPAGLVVIVALGAYVNSVGNGFLYDDDHVIQNDPRTSDASRWRDIFTEGYWHRSSDDPIYRPIPLLTYLANYLVTGFSPAGYRVVNLALHAAVSLLVYAIAVQLFRRRWAAVIAALLFAVHPIHGEVVVIIIGRADLLCALFFLLAVWRMLDEPMVFPSRFSPRFAGVLGLLALALLSKENAVTFVGVAVLADVWRRWRAADNPRARPWRTFLRDRLINRYLPMLAVVALFLLARYQVFHRLTRAHGVIGGGIDNPLDYAGPFGRLLTPFVLLGKYLNLLVWPSPLCYDYSINAIPVASSWADPRIWVGVGWAVLLLVVAAVSRRRRRQLLCCVAFFVVTYSVVSNAIVLIGTLFAERLMYLPSVAWCWAVGLAAAALCDRLGAAGSAGRYARHVVTGVVVLALAGYGAKTVTRNARVLCDNESLYLDGVRVNPGSSRCQSAAARVYAAKGNRETAIQHFRKALDIDDTAWYDHMLIGQEYVLDGKVELGLKHLHRAYELSTGRFRFDPAFLLGQVYVRRERPDLAIDWLGKALAAPAEHTSRHALCVANLAYALMRVEPPRRDLPRALEYIEQALAAAPDDLGILEIAYGIYMAAKRPARAADVVHRALQIVPKTSPAFQAWQRRSTSQ